MQEVNDYYTRVKPSLRQFTPDDVIKASAIPPRTPLGPLLLHLLRFAIWLRSILKWPFFFALLGLIAAEIALLRLLAAPPRQPRSRLHQRAAELADEFVAQYPLWPYSILTKSLGWAFLDQHLPHGSEDRKHVLELAIGEGSFSKRVFSGDDNVVGVDVNPVSLSKAARMPNVSKAIVGNCLAPPIAPGSFSVIVANNFLHHVSDKGGTLSRWAQIAPRMIFNESTPLWSQGWPVPRFFRVIGLRPVAAFCAALLDRLGSQDLLTESVLTELVDKHVDITDKQTYFAENTYLFATLPCLVALNMGAIPEELKQIAQKKLFRSLTARMTRTLTRLLIEYDERQARDRDVFISYAVSSRFCSANTLPVQVLMCASCGKGRLHDDGSCPACGQKYRTIDGMLFLLEPGLKHIEDSYDPADAAAFASEHL